MNKYMKTNYILRTDHRSLQILSLLQTKPDIFCKRIYTINLKKAKIPRHESNIMCAYCLPVCVEFGATL